MHWSHKPCELSSKFWRFGTKSGFNCRTDYVQKVAMIGRLQIMTGFEYEENDNEQYTCGDGTGHIHEEA